MKKEGLGDEEGGVREMKKEGLRDEEGGVRG